MIKHLNGWNMSKKVHKSECKIYAKSFPCTKTLYEGLRETIIKKHTKPFYFTGWNQ